MSIASELNRLLQAKSDLATSITNKGVTVPAATTIDGYAALVDQIQQGGTQLDASEIEYLKSTGSQYIDTGIKPNNNSAVRFVTSFECSNANRRIIVGSYYAGTASDKGLSIEIFKDSNNNKLRLYSIYNGAVVNNLDTHTLPFDTPINIDITLDCISNTWSGTLDYNNNSYNISVSASPNMGTQPRSFRLYLDYRTNTSTVSYPLTLYFFKIYVDNQLVRNFVPLRVGAIGYLFDEVSRTLFGNAGTGSFTLGPDVT